MALPAGRADWRGCPPDGNERINALLNCVVEVEAEIPVPHGEDPGPQAVEFRVQLIAASLIVHLLAVPRLCSELYIRPLGFCSVERKQIPQFVEFAKRDGAVGSREAPWQAGAHASRSTGGHWFGRRSAARTAARLCTITLPAPLFGKYTTTFRPKPVADGNTTLSIPASIQIWARPCEAVCLPGRRARSITFCRLGTRGMLKSRFR
jgi:hypothetical protein